MSSPRAKVHILVGPRSTVRVRILSTPPTLYLPFSKHRSYNSFFVKHVQQNTNDYPRRNFTGPFEKMVFQRIEKASEKNRTNQWNYRLKGPIFNGFILQIALLKIVRPTARQEICNRAEFCSFQLLQQSVSRLSVFPLATRSCFERCDKNKPRWQTATNKNIPYFNSPKIG